MIGNILLATSFGAAFFRLFIRKNFLFYIASICLISASIFLEIAFLRSDFTIQNVLFFSSLDSPIIYKMAGLWTNSDSSLLFLSSLLSLLCLVSCYKEGDHADFIARIYAVFVFFLSAYIYFFANPFIEVKAPPAQGLGLNPVLQDVAVSIHPPILYLGYVAYIVPFAYALLMLHRKEIKTDCLNKMLIYARFGLFCLSSGIALGSWWAYRELGWGGFWFFDPVENVSLMLWMIGIAMYHYLMQAPRNSRFVVPSVSLSLINFLLIIVGIILVRSGSLVSVHSFSANVEAGKYIIIIFVCLVLSSTYLYFSNIRSLREDLVQKYNYKETIIICGSKFIYLATISIFVAIIYPLLYGLINGVSITLDNKYFHIIFIPLSIIICVFSFISLFLTNISFNLKTIFKNRNHAMVFSHLGIVILAMGVFLNSYRSQDLEFVGNVGKEIEYDADVKVRLQNLYYSNGPNYYRQIADFWVFYKGQIVNLKPENRLYRVENMLSSESDIYSFIAKDFYAVIGNIDSNGILFANIYIRPWMSMIWLGMFLTSVGVLLSMFRRVP